MKSRYLVRFLACLLVLSWMGVGFAFTGYAEADKLSGKLVYWSMWNEIEPQGQVLSEAIEEFKAQNPDVNIEVNWCGREIDKVLIPALQSGQQIDIFEQNVEMGLVSWRDYLLPLDELAEQVYPSTNGRKYIDALASASVDYVRKVAGDGKLYTVPYQPFLFVFLYNKAHFADAGITETPKTWEELDAACAKLLEKGYIPLTTDPGYAMSLGGFYLAHMKGVEWVKELVADTSKAMWDDPAVLQFAKAYEDFQKKGYFSSNVLANQWPAGQQEIANETVSMYLNGTWLPNEIIDTAGPDFPWGAFGYPAVPGGVLDHTVQNMGSQGFYINKNTADPNLALNLVAWFTTGKWDQIQSERSYSIPVGADTDWSPLLADAKAIFDDMTDTMMGAGGVGSNPDTAPVFKAEFVKLCGGAITAEQFIENMKNQ